MMRLALPFAFVVLLAISFAPASAGPTTWTTNGPAVQGVLWRLALDPTRNATIYAAGSSGNPPAVAPKVFRSIDTGATWQELTGGIVNVQINALTVDPTNGTTLYVGGYNPVAKSLAVYKSTNSGVNWTLLAWPFQGGDLDRPVLSVSVDARDNRNLYVGTSTGVLKSTNQGDTWTALGGGLPIAAVRSIVVDRANGAIVYVATDGGIYKSTNGGTNWSPSNNGLPSAPGGSLPRASQLASDPTNPATLFTVVAGAAGDQVFRSQDAAAGWANASAGLPNDVIRNLAVDPRNTRNLFAALNGGSGQNMVRSTDSGVSWTAFPLPGGGYSSSVVMDNVDPQTLHVGHNDSVWSYTFGGSGVVTPAGTVTPAGATPGPGTPTVTVPVPTSVAGQAPRDNRFFQETGFRIDNDAFWDYFNRRGGTRTFGFPISRTFTLQGFPTQFFQRLVIQWGPDGRVRSINLLDPGVMPFTSFNSAIVPGPDAGLTNTAPAPGTPNYAGGILDWTRQNAPNVFDGKAVNFAANFDSTVTMAIAYPTGGGDPSLLPGINLELWGIPTSRPAYDPNNRNFVYQRFQRGIMHFDQGCLCTQGLLLADYLKAIITGRNLPPDVAAQAAQSPYLRQYNFGKPGWVDRPEQLPGTDLTGAFEPQ